MINRIALFLFAALGIAMSVWDIDDKIEAKYPIMGYLLSLIPVIVGVLVVGFLLVGLLELYRIAQVIWLRESPSNLRNITCVNCRNEDLDRIYAIGESQIGNVTNIDDTRKLYNHNKNCFHKIVDTQKNEIIGYFCVLPLTKKGIEKVEDRDLLSGSFDSDYFAKRFGSYP